MTEKINRKNRQKLEITIFLGHHVTMYLLTLLPLFNCHLKIIAIRHRPARILVRQKTPKILIEHECVIVGFEVPVKVRVPGINVHRRSVDFIRKIFVAVCGVTSRLEDIEQALVFEADRLGSFFSKVNSWIRNWLKEIFFWKYLFHNVSLI